MYLSPIVKIVHISIVQEKRLLLIAFKITIRIRGIMVFSLCRSLANLKEYSSKCGTSSNCGPKIDLKALLTTIAKTPGSTYEKVKFIPANRIIAPRRDQCKLW